jgi:hypothetical protein
VISLEALLLHELDAGYLASISAFSQCMALGCTYGLPTQRKTVWALTKNMIGKEVNIQRHGTDDRPFFAHTCCTLSGIIVASMVLLEANVFTICLHEHLLYFSSLSLHSVLLNHPHQTHPLPPPISSTFFTPQNAHSLHRSFVHTT